MTHTSREYAEALHALAEESGEPGAYLAGLELTEKAVEENRGLLSLLASPAIPRSERMEVLPRIFGEDLPSPMLALLRLMVSRGHAREIPRMMEEYRKLERESRGESTARVTSAAELTAEEKESLRAKLEKRFGRRMVLECSVDPALLGGVRVETEGRVLDGTLRARLQEIKEVMNS